jgi:hypothetical protein
MTGGEVVFDDEGYTRCAGPVRFVFDQTKLSEDETFLYEDGGTLNPVENGEYVISSQEASEGEASFDGVSFFIKDGQGELLKLNSRPYRADITDGIYEKPQTVIAQDQDGYVIKVKPVRYMHTYVSVRGTKNGFLEEIESDTEIAVHDDGRYDVEIYSEDGMGHRTVADTERTIVLDRQAPVMGDTDKLPEVSASPVSLKLTAWDGVSGVEGIYIKVGDSDAVRSDTLELYPPFNGRVECWAVDNMGNISDSVCLGDGITIDSEPPEVEISKAEMDGKKLIIMTKATDDLSGVEDLRIYDGENCVYERKGSDENARLDAGDLIYGERTYTVIASDRAGNEVSGSFTVSRQDGTQPVIEMSGADDKGIYGSPVRIRISASDDSGCRCRVSETVEEYSLAGEYRGETKRDAGSEGEPGELNFEKSGVYIVRVEASDEAGNTSRQAVAFAIDREAPDINGMDGLDGSRLKSFMLDRTKDIVTDDSLVQYDMKLNGIRYDGEEITKSGRYRMQIYAVDEFGNSSSKDLSFSIGKERP